MNQVSTLAPTITTCSQPARCHTTYRKVQILNNQLKFVIKLSMLNDNRKSDYRMFCIRLVFEDTAIDYHFQTLQV